MIRIAVRATAVAVIAFSAMGLAGTAFADEDTTGGGDTATTQSTSARSTDAGLPLACTLLPEDLAQKTIDERADLVLASTSGGAECLYKDADDSGSYAVDLDVSMQSAGSLDQARAVWSQPGVEIADASGLGEGAFSGLNGHLDAVVVCAKDGVQFDLEVWAPEGDYAQKAVRTLAEKYCTPDTAAAAHPAADTAKTGAADPKAADTKAADTKAAATEPADTDSADTDPADS
jgi:hypothetical protein